MTDPKIVVDAIVDGDRQKGQKISIFPMTIRRYAYLELIGSPFTDSSVPFNVQTVVQSAFVFTHSSEELKKFSSSDAEAIKQAAYDWADECLSPEDMPELVKMMTKQMTDLNKAAPDAASGDSTDEQQDGSKKN